MIFIDILLCKKYISTFQTLQLSKQPVCSIQTSDFLPLWIFHVVHHVYLLLYIYHKPRLHVLTQVTLIRISVFIRTRISLIWIGIRVKGLV